MNDPASGGTIPVHLLTGFLGSGKTTLLNRLLRSAWMEGTLVIVNEFGEVGLDHLLIEAPADETVLLANGCLCCTVNGDFLLTLSRLIARRDAGEVPPFDRVVIETTGLADPVPILRTLHADTLVASRYALRGVIAVVDALNGLKTISCHQEAFRQVSAATHVLVSKGDLAPPGAIDEAMRQLRQINRDACIGTTALPDAKIVALFDQDADPLPRAVLDRSAFAAEEVTHLAAGTRISTFVLRHEGEVSQQAFRLWLNALGRFRGPNLLRLKGIVNLDGEPVVIQAVQDIVHDPIVLGTWPSVDHRTEIVFITQNIGRKEIEPTLAALSFGRIGGTAGSLPFGGADFARFVAVVRGFAPMERT